MTLVEPILQIRNLEKSYPGVRALDGVSLCMNRGEVHALVGENGAGKSTLIKILAGAVEPDEGDIIIEGKRERLANPLESLEKGIAVTFQDLGLFPNLSVAENIAIRREIQEHRFRLNWRSINKLAQDSLKELGADIDPGQQLGYLSLANQQLVAIARAIVHDAKVLVLDEPTASLSKEDVVSVFKAINVLKGRGMSVLFVSHKLDEVFEIADRITVLRDGRYVGTYDKKGITESQLISHMVGRNVHYARYDAKAPGEPLLSVAGLSKRGNFKDVSFSLHKGEVLGITGLVGSGRTELAQALFGCSQPDEGEIYLDGRAVSIASTSQAVKMGIGYVPENRKIEGLALDKTLEENETITIVDKIKNSLGLVDENKRRQIAEHWIDKLRITPPYPHMPIGNFSGGNQQKAVIAKWLACELRILIIDEPTHGIDIGAKSEIHRLLRRLAETGLGIIVISSEIPEILAISDRILIMRRGRIVSELAGNCYSEGDILDRAILGSGSTCDVEAGESSW
ncbi:MAG: sugar ABC transporter ATP-binding protein [Clostridia bacterium]|nr:sugar ABC transporter ATP-binding protein [Clostridia bacterium]